MEEKKKNDEEKKKSVKSEDGGQKSPSGRVSRTSKTYQILEAQGMIIGRTLGSGSYATVKSAYDVNRKHKVAIKVINKKKAFEEYLTKFLPRELDAMRNIGNHNNVVAFHQIIETTSRYFFIMELVEGGDLLEAIRAKKTIEEGQAGIWFIHLFEGLSHLHSKGLVHRDIKCENLLLDKENNLKVADFGFAKKIVKNKSGSIVLSETYCGSYAYAAPEILKGQPYDPILAEVWSMGVVLFTMVYGRLPFDDKDHKKLIKQTAAGVVFPTKPEVSEKCHNLIYKLLSKAQGRITMRLMKSDAWFKKQKTNADEKHKADHELKVEMELAEEMIISEITISTSEMSTDKVSTEQPERATVATPTTGVKKPIVL